jgi:hypothetical protein
MLNPVMRSALVPLEPSTEQLINSIEGEFVILIQSHGSDKVYVSTQSVGDPEEGEGEEDDDDDVVKVAKM